MAALVVGAAGCASGASTLPLPPSAATVQVRLLDDDLVVDRPVPAGRVIFRITNAGRAAHRLALIPLPEDFPPLEEELANEQGRSAPLQARVPDLPPGAVGMFAADLIAGQRYALVDFSRSAEGTVHARLGVAAEFRPREGAGPAASPAGTPSPR